MSGTEILIILVIGIIVVGPKKLPGMMRSAGRWIARARRMTTDVRASSGIDKLIREEGLENEIRELSSLTRSNVLSSLVNPLAATQRAVTNFARSPVLAAAASTPAAKPAEVNGAKASSGVTAPEVATAESAAPATDLPTHLIKPAAGNVARKNQDEALRALAASGLFSIREREYPTMGCDAYDVLPDDIDDPEAYADDPPAEAPAAEALPAEAPPAHDQPSGDPS
jgi:sec-independent protein translocase protein TatB